MAEIDIKANVCCAKYNTESMYEIAVGAADHTVLSYDLRKSDKAVHVFKGELLPKFAQHVTNSASALNTCQLEFESD